MEIWFDVIDEYLWIGNLNPFTIYLGKYPLQIQTAIDGKSIK